MAFAYSSPCAFLLKTSVVGNASMVRFVIIRMTQALMLCAVLGVSNAEAKTSSKPKLPNIVFILVDDLSMDLFQYQGTIDALLAKQGVVFKNHFVNLASCCPSRVSTLRGQYAHNTGIYANEGQYGGFERVNAAGLENSTVATWLQGAGYRTALFGKYLNGYPLDGSPSYIPPGWSYWVSPNDGTPYEEYDYSLNENGQAVAYGNGPKHYMVDVLAEKAVGFIRNTVKNYSGRPFFIYLAPYAPHGPATPAPRYASAFSDGLLPHPKSFNEDEIADKPAWVRRLPKLASDEIGAMDRSYRKRLQSMAAVEDLVRKIVLILQDTKQLGNTYIFFTSDNGFHQGQHRLPSGKNTAYEEDIHIPLVVRGPGIPPGLTIDELTANVDYAPTFAAMAKITPPDFVDGRNLLPLMLGKQPQRWRRAMLLEHKAPSVTQPASSGLREPQDPHDIRALAEGEAPVFTGIRTSDALTYVEYETGERELYDLVPDPRQLTNIYDGADPILKSRLSAWLLSLSKSSGKALRKVEAQPPQ